MNRVLDGWEGYNTSLVHAVAPLTPDQLSWRPSKNLRTTGELVRHISLGRLTWFARMDPAGWSEVVRQVSEWATDDDGNRYPHEASLLISTNPAGLADWLETTWKAVAGTISGWTVSDLFRTYQHTWNGQKYAISRQWTVFRILAHDLHHGGELSLMLGSQGIQAFELSDLGGHIILPPLYG